jgi:Flp pilus assembly protein TadG
MRNRERDRGAVAVEFALILPVFLVLLVGMVDFGFAFNAKIALTQAAREGARVVALGGNEGEARTRVNLALTNEGRLLTAATEAQECPVNPDFDDMATVSVTATVETLLPIDDISLSAEGVMQCAG